MSETDQSLHEYKYHLLLYLSWDQYRLLDSAGMLLVYIFALPSTSIFRYVYTGFLFRTLLLVCISFTYNS